MEITENIVVNNSVGNTPTKSPWGKSPVVTPCSLASVMDEEVAKELQAKEDYLAGYHLQGDTGPSGITFEGNELTLIFLSSQLIKFTLNISHGSCMTPQGAHTSNVTGHYI